MICHELTSILPLAALCCGSKMNELFHRGDLTPSELDAINYGKEASIEHMMQGGTGLPFRASIMTTAFDIGCSTERRDLRTMLAWAKSYDQCKRDRWLGRVS